MVKLEGTYVIDRLENIGEYAGLGANFAKACEFIAKGDFGSLKPGRNDIDGDNVFVNCVDAQYVAQADRPNEIHRRYFDIHVPITGDEVDGYIYDEANAKANAAGFVEKDDYVLFRNPKMRKVNVAKGEFAIFYPPYGAHAPNKTDGASRAHRKLVVKVRI